jgi:hypothetical protein
LDTLSGCEPCLTMTRLAFFPPGLRKVGDHEILAKLNAQPKAVRTDAEQVCAATDGGRLVPTLDTRNPHTRQESPQRGFAPRGRGFCNSAPSRRVNPDTA